MASIIEDDIRQLGISNPKIRNLISATHVPTEKDFDADSLFVVVKKILKRFDNILRGKEDPEIPEGEVLRDLFDPTWGTVEQLSSEMSHKTLNIKTAYKTAMSILNKLRSYSWQSKAVLALATFALDYKKYVWATAQHESSAKRIQSVEIPKHDLVTVDLQKYKNVIIDMKEKIYAITEGILELEKQKNLFIIDREDVRRLLDAMDDIPAAVFWIIMSTVACTNLMFCLPRTEKFLPLTWTTYDEITPMIDLDYTWELFSLASTFNYKLGRGCWSIRFWHEGAEKRKAKRRMKDFLHPHGDEVTEVLKALIFGKDDVQLLIEGFSNEQVSLDVLKNKGVLLFITDLHVSGDDILIMKPIYEEIMHYNIVWIPILVQWTDALRKKFDMLRSQMPWYVLQYFSQLAGIKFIREDWHFEDDPIVVAMDSQGNVLKKNLLPVIRREGTDAYPLSICRFEGAFMRPGGPHTMEDYTFNCGGKDSRWIEQFSEKVNAVGEDPVIKEACISIQLSHIEKDHKWNPFRKPTRAEKKKEEILKLLPSFENERRWAVLVKWSTRTVGDDGPTILKVLETFEEWKKYVPEKGFEICFKQYYAKLRQTNPNPSTSPTV